MMSEAWAGICALAVKDGIGAITDVPGGAWERRIGEHWRVVLNGPRPNNVAGVELPPFAALVEWNGWPAGIIAPGGGMLAMGGQANEASFIGAIEAELGSTVEEWFRRPRNAA